MLTVAVLQQKGGSGKTTLAINLAAAAHLDGGRALVVDMDRQASAFDWSAARQDGSELEPVREEVVVTEAVPTVHHLGDDRYDGRINSQFQRKSEGARFTAEFELSDDQLPPRFNEANVLLLAKGIQRRHRILINDTLLDRRLDQSPGDGSFGEFRAPFDPAVLVAGSNTISIVAAPSSSDIDDFEFVNVRILLSP